MKFNVIWVSAKNGAFNVTGKKSFFVFDDFVCFLLTRILSIDFVNNYIDFVNNFQLIKYGNFAKFSFISEFYLLGWRSLNALFFCFCLSAKVWYSDVLYGTSDRFMFHELPVTA